MTVAPGRLVTKLKWILGAKAPRLPPRFHRGTFTRPQAARLHWLVTQPWTTRPSIRRPLVADGSSTPSIRRPLVTHGSSIPSSFLALIQKQKVSIQQAGSTVAPERPNFSSNSITRPTRPVEFVLISKLNRAFGNASKASSRVGTRTPCARSGKRAPPSTEK